MSKLPAASQVGGRRVTDAPGGGRHLNENTGGEEARGGERDARAGKVGCIHGARTGESRGGGEGGGTTAIKGTNVNSSKKKARV